MPSSESILVFISCREETCAECGASLPQREWITFDRARRVLCLACADLDHLVYLPAGNTALTVRAKKHSTLSAVVLKWSKARRRNERQGLLVEEDALETAEEECLADDDARARRRERDALRRERLDADFVGKFAARIVQFFPGCPVERAQLIAEHACLKSSGRIGRTAAAKNFEESAVRLAVVAHVRHAETSYDQLLATGYDRHEARSAVHGQIMDTLSDWEAG